MLKHLKESASHSGLINKLQLDMECLAIEIVEQQEAANIHVHRLIEDRIWLCSTTAKLFVLSRDNSIFLSSERFQISLNFDVSKATATTKLCSIN